jgi:hypothetical protein
MTITRQGVRYDISVGSGVYYVVQITNDGMHTYIVGKDKLCSCGGSADRPCRHIEAVSSYLKRGGSRAPQQMGNNSDPALRADTQVDTKDRDEKVYKFFTQPHPAKMGAFYEQSLGDRETFLTAAKQRYNEYLRSVYAH